MPNALERLKAAGGTNSVGGYSFIDADTIRDKDDPNVRYRLQGYDAPEVAGIKGDRWKTGTAGSAIATSTITGLAESQGFSNLVKTGKFDPNGREIVELHDDSGRNFTDMIYKYGLLDPGKYATQQSLDAAEVGKLFEGTDSEWTEAAKTVQEGIAAESIYEQTFKQAAINEAQYAARPDLYTTNVEFRHGGRDIRNKSLSPFSDNWEKGWIGVKEASYGVLDLLGDSTGVEALSDIGENGVERARTGLAEYGTALTDYKDVRGFGTAIEYLTNNLALSLPYMVGTVGASLAAPVTGGASLAVPAAIYAGQTYNEQEEKNAGIAIASGILQGTFDRLGLGLILKPGAKATKDVWNQGIQALIKKGNTPEQAAALLSQASRKEIAGFTKDAAAAAKKQIEAKNVFKGLVNRGLIGSTGEAVTEGLQEATGYTAAHWNEVGTSDFDFAELNERILAGAIAGGALGGAFTVPGSLYEAGAWADVAVRQAPAEAKRLSQAARWAEQEVRENGRVTSIEENNAVAAATASPADATAFQDRIDRHKSAQKQRSTSDALFDAASSAPALWQGATRFIFQNRLLEQSRALRKLADSFGGQLQKTFSGSNFENAKHHKVTVYKNMVGIPQEVFAAFNGGKHANRKVRGDISKRIYAAINNAIDTETGKINYDQINGNNAAETAALRKTAKDLERLGNKLWTDQKKHNPDLGFIQNYLTRYKSFNKKSIVDNRDGFINALVDEFPNMTRTEAKEIADSITDSADINDIGDALDAVQAAAKPGSHKRRSLDLSERDAFQEFFEQDLFANVANASKSAARYVAHQEYVGDNNSVIEAYLKEAAAEGVPQADLDKIAAQMQDYLLAESGNYKRPTTDRGKQLQNIQRSFMMVTTIAGLPLATVSSFVEIALTMKALTKDQMFGKGGGLSTLAYELAQTLKTGMQNVVDIPARAVDKGRVQVPAATAGKEKLADLGFYDWDVGAATTTGVSEIKPWQQDIYENFFKWTGLQGWTNYTRSVRASIAGDYIVDKLNTILEADPSNPTNETQEAREALRNLGINVEDMLAAYQGNGQFDPNSAALLEENFREATFNFINDAVALPQAQNRPLIYQDPRFALFTQFQGFIATFTANHIPKLWGEYVKRGTPAMKYNAFAVMTTMVMMGFASQYLKDLIKYGDLGRPFGPDDHPFLDTSQYLQRGVRASGLLGSGERVLDQFFPLYDQRSKGIGDWAFNGVVGESPALGFIKSGGEGVGGLLTGDVGKAAKEVVRHSPLGPFNFIRDYAEDKFSAWNFNGE